MTDPVNGQEAAPRAPSQLAHNTILNVFGLGVPLLVAFVVMPVALHALGAVRFGLLGLAWAATEYLALFDLGMGRATVRFIAEASGRGGREIGTTAATAIVTQAATGIIGAIVFVILTPFFVTHVFHVPASEQREAIGMFRVVALNLPIVLLLTTLRGVLEGVQRFDVTNAVKIGTGASAVIIPAIAARAGMGLPTIMFFVLLSRVAGCIVLEHWIRKVISGFKWARPDDWAHAKKMLFFGGWVSVSSAVSPILVYFDRFSLAAIAGLAAVGYYTAPYEGVSRLLFLPISLVGTLFPALTWELAHGDRVRASALVSRANRHLVLIMAAPVAVLVGLSPLLLRVWLGVDVAESSATALRILALGVFVNALAHPSYVFLYAIGRPDLPAKFHLTELCFHLPLTWLLVTKLGVTGAAAAWAIRVAVDWALLTLFTRRNRAELERSYHQRTRKVLIVIGTLAAAAIASAALVPVSSPAAIAVMGIGTLVYAALAWMFALDDAERTLVRSMARWYLTGGKRTAS